MDPMQEALTFDDVLLIPAKSDILPSEADVKTQLTREIQLNIPIVSSAMDTVTEARLAIALAQEGGIGIVHKAMPIEKQVIEVDKVKRSESGMIVDPITIRPDARVADALDLMARYRISGVPVVDAGGRIVGVITQSDLVSRARPNPGHAALAEPAAQSLHSRPQQLRVCKLVVPDLSQKV